MTTFSHLSLPDASSCHQSYRPPNRWRKLKRCCWCKAQRCKRSIGSPVDSHAVLERAPFRRPSWSVYRVRVTYLRREHPITSVLFVCCVNGTGFHSAPAMVKQFLCVCVIVNEAEICKHYKQRAPREITGVRKCGNSLIANVHLLAKCLLHLAILLLPSYGEGEL